MFPLKVMMHYIFQGIVEDVERESGVRIGRFLMASFLPLNMLLGIAFSMNPAVYDSWREGPEDENSAKHLWSVRKHVLAELVRLLPRHCTHLLGAYLHLLARRDPRPGHRELPHLPDHSLHGFSAVHDPGA